MNERTYSRKPNFLWALIVSLFLAYFSGWREVGVDRENYLKMYQSVIISDDWAVKLAYANDVMFLLIIAVSNYFSDDPKLAFFIICLSSVATKYFAIRRAAPGHALGFILLYAVFLSPGLEFAAMRGALSIGFLMLALSCRDKKLPFVIFCLSAVASHVSVVLALIFVVDRVNQLLTKNKLIYAFVVIGVSSFTSGLLNLFPRGAIYEYNQGTVLAYSLPLATLFIAILIFHRLDELCIQHPADSGYRFIASLRPPVYGLIAIAFGISAEVVTAATRYLEISWCLMLLASVVLFNKSPVNFLGGVLLLVFLSYVNVVRLTWLFIVYPLFG